MQTCTPRILVPGLPGFVPAPVRKPATPDDAVSGLRLALRLQALASALDDLPGHALRLARLRASRRAAAARDKTPHLLRPSRRVLREWPLKPGRPPGWRRRARHEVHHVLEEAHGLAILSMEKPDTS
jgi:hypothetical protein